MVYNAVEMSRNWDVAQFKCRENGFRANGISPFRVPSDARLAGRLPGADLRSLEQAESRRRLGCPSPGEAEKRDPQESVWFAVQSRDLVLVQRR